MIISKNIRDLFAQHSDIMLPLLEKDPAAVDAFISIVMGGDPELPATILSSTNGSSYLAQHARHAVEMASVVTREIESGQPVAQRIEWEEQAINAVNNILIRYDHLKKHT